MLLDNLYKKLTALAATCLIVSPAIGQETIASNPQPATATLTADGQLTGNVMVLDASETNKIPVANVSLVSQGKVIDSVKTDTAGQFSFANVNPGPYQLVGTAAGMLGSNALTVAPFAKAQPVTPSKLTLQHTSAPGAYTSFSNAPVSAMSYPTTGYAGGGGVGGGFGGGVGGGMGGGLGGRLLGRGLLSSPRGLLVVGGVAGGLAAALSDSSPDQ